MSDLWIIYCIVFAAVILIVQALYWLIVGAQRRSATLKRRLALSARHRGPRACRHSPSGAGARQFRSPEVRELE